MAEATVAARPNLREFTVEFSTPNCGRVTINTLQLVVEGEFSIPKLHARDGGCRNANVDMARMPEIPGCRMKVVPRTKTVTLFDPIENDPKLLARVNDAARRAHLKGDERWAKRMEKVEHKLDDDRFKSLMRDLVQLREGNALKVVDGEMPTMEQVNELPGRVLFDQWNNSPTKPVYADEFQDWARRVDRGG